MDLLKSKLGSTYYVVPPISQGGFETPIVKNVVGALNKYEDAVLLGEHQPGMLVIV